MAISKRLRYEVLRRDNYSCRYCGRGAPEVKLTVDHVVPEALGGTDDPSNLVAACIDCNAGKSSASPDAPLVADVAADALRWSRAMQQAAEASRAALQLKVKRRELFRAEIWGGWTYEYKGKRWTFDLPSDWEGSIDRFCEAGINDEDFAEAVRIAMTARSVKASDIFRYMCGILWKVVSERQQIAMQILDGEAPGDGS